MRAGSALLAEETGRRLGEHLCCLYDNEPDMLAIAVPFIISGLMNDEKCAVIADEEKLHVFCGRLKESCVDINRFVASRQLTFREDPEGCPLSSTAINLGDSYLRRLGRRFAYDGAWRGYRCVFLVTDFLCHRTATALIEREIMLKQLLARMPAVLLLMYDRRAISDTVVTDMLEIHPRVIDRGTIYENKSYILPEELL